MRKQLRKFALERRRLWEALIAAFQYLQGSYKGAGKGCFTRAGGRRTRGKLKVKVVRFR